MCGLCWCPYFQVSTLTGSTEQSIMEYFVYETSRVNTYILCAQVNKGQSVYGIHAHAIVMTSVAVKNSLSLISVPVSCDCSHLQHYSACIYTYIPDTILTVSHNIIMCINYTLHCYYSNTNTYPR